jgi:segregation and condensation protein B
MYSKKTMKSALETMMFMWGEPLEIKDAAEVLEADKKEIRELFAELQAEYEQEGRGIRIREAGDAFGFVTYVENDIFVKKLCTPVRVRRLSQAALEVLAIIAYRQPVTRSEIDSIRGIKSERVIDGLMDKGLVEVAGRSEGVGRPLIYATTREFLKKFGFTSLKDLPEVPEYEEMRREREEQGYGQMSLDFDEADAGTEASGETEESEHAGGSEQTEQEYAAGTGLGQEADTSVPADWKYIKSLEKQGREWEEEYLFRAFDESAKLIEVARERKRKKA